MKKILSLILAAIMLLTLMPMAYAEGKVKKTGDIIQFGEYPQTKVTDESLIDNLNQKAQPWENWTSYDYHSGDGKYGSMTSGDWMRYTDVVYGGTKYRGVRFTQCRPHYVFQGSPTSYTENTYRVNTTYWFKYEPLKWRVLDVTTGLVMCETIIDSQPYSNTVYYNAEAASETFAYFNNKNFDNYANDYETSSIRLWLNSDFYSAAFSAAEQNDIMTTALNNDGYYTLTGAGDYKSLDSKATNDKIFLLSYDQATNPAYGFSAHADTDGVSRRAQGTDYAECQGLWVSDNYNKGNSYWLLRTPGDKSSSACYVNVDGYVSCTYSVSYSVYGVRPAMTLGSIVHIHDYAEEKTLPTCADGGFTTYTCDCGYSYVGDRVNAVDHKDDNDDKMCDFGCGYEYKEPTVSESKIEAFFRQISDWFKSIIDKLFGWLS